ncbi:hypothetical protein [Haloarchaeobius amylolyticus]|uniref:hypothetical protein n=1 Tax=Haloarchaeobius amylolyticus TaxID=1198296 RepID=UPI00226FFF51|nr:hypothetical protein [Haloarchaeobius amylolyticus]
MPSRDISATFRSRIQGYLRLRVLAVWSTLTLLIVAYAYISVMPSVARKGILGRELIFPLPLALLGLVVGGLVFASWYRQPLYAVGSMVFLGLAVVPFPQACLGVGCSGVERLHVFFDWSMFGPAVSASFDTGRCAYICPYRVSLLPLGVGYVLIGKMLSPTNQ